MQVCIFGYPYDMKGWKVFDLEIEELLIFCDVVFNEDNFLFAQQLAHENQASLPLLTPARELDFFDGERNQPHWEEERLPTQVHEENVMHDCDNAVQVKESEQPNDQISVPTCSA